MGDNKHPLHALDEALGEIRGNSEVAEALEQYEVDIINAASYIHYLQNMHFTVGTLSSIFALGYLMASEEEVELDEDIWGALEDYE